MELSDGTIIIFSFTTNMIKCIIQDHSKTKLL